jgi:hypothetical protein
MQIRFIKSTVYQRSVYLAGTEMDFPDDQARELITRGDAEPVSVETVAPAKKKSQGA